MVMLVGSQWRRAHVGALRKAGKGYPSPGRFVFLSSVVLSFANGDKIIGYFPPFVLFFTIALVRTDGVTQGCQEGGRGSVRLQLRCRVLLCAGLYVCVCVQMRAHVCAYVLLP